MQKNWFTVFSVKVTVRAYIIKIWLFLFYLLYGLLRHVGIRGNEAADREALQKEPIDDLMPFSDLKPLTAKYIHQIW